MTMKIPDSTARACAWAIVAWALAVSVVSAQTTSSSLSGTVRTRAGGPVPGAVVQARSDGAGGVRSVVTDDRGRYRLDSLLPGSWLVAARLAGGGISESRVVELRLQQTVRLDFVVDTGLAERVTVTAERPLVDPRQTGGQLSLSGETISTMPTTGRVFTDLALLNSAAGAAPASGLAGEREAVFMLNGQSARSNSFLVDGLDNNDHTSGTNLNSFYSQQIIQEFVLMTHQYSPEFGRASGGVLNIITRRGGSEHSGEAFVEGTSSSWNSAGTLVDSLPDSGYSQDSNSRLSAGFNFSGPIREDKAFYFVAYEHRRADEVIPFTGVTDDGVVGGRLVAPADDDNLFVRADFNLGENHTLMTRVSFDERSDGGQSVGGVHTPEVGFTFDEQDLTFASSLTSVISPRLVNEVRLLAARSTLEQTANSRDPRVEHPSGIWGGSHINSQLRDEDRVQLVENLTWSSANHTTKFGVDVVWSDTRIQVGFNPLGSFLYDTDEDEAGEIVEAALSYSLVSGLADQNLTDTKVALFAQDRWDVGAGLLLDYGLRYDVNSYTLPGRVDSVIPNGNAQRDTDNIAPRFGFTYTPGKKGKWVIRGGAGIFYDKLVLGFPAAVAVTSGTSIALTFPGIFQTPFNESWFDTWTDRLLPIFIIPELALRFSSDTELETPFNVQYTLGFDRALGKHHAIRANVVHALGYNLPLMRDLNPVRGLFYIGTVCDENYNDPTFETGDLPCHLDDPTTGSIAAITTTGQSWYTGVDLRWRWQGENAWLSTSYTWADAEDLGPDPLKGDLYLPPDSDNLRGERARSDGARKHGLVLAGDLGLPWAGLRMSGVLRLSSGLPYNVTTGRDDNLDGLTTDRPEGVGRNSGKHTDLTVVNELRVEAGLPPVESLSEPSFSQIDLRLYRQFQFRGGRSRGEIYFQVINVLDQENPGLIEGRVLAGNFGGVIGLAGPPRSIELGLKFGY